MRLKASGLRVTGRREQRSITAAILFLCRMICPASRVSAACSISRHVQLSCGGGEAGRIPDRPQKLFIHEEICEGCGDCARKSNCVAVKPVVRPEGIKRQIDQTVCNKDYSCNEGFCPSFIAVTPQTAAAPARWSHGLSCRMRCCRRRLHLPASVISSLPASAGQGVDTLGVLVMAARIDGIAAQAVNQTGLSQKNGGVTAQIRMSAETRLDDRMVRLPGGSADLLLGCDAVVAANDVVLRTLNRKPAQLFSTPGLIRWCCRGRGRACC